MLTVPTHACSPLSMSPTTVVHLLYDEPTLSHHNHPKYKIYRGFSLDVLCSAGLDKCIMTCSHHCHIIQKILSPKILYSSLHSSILPPTFSNHWSFSCLRGFAFSRKSYSWNHTACSLSLDWLLSQSNIHPSFSCLFMAG